MVACRQSCCFAAPALRRQYNVQGRRGGGVQKETIAKDKGTLNPTGTLSARIFTPDGHSGGPKYLVSKGWAASAGLGPEVLQNDA